MWASSSTAAPCVRACKPLATPLTRPCLTACTVLPPDLHAHVHTHSLPRTRICMCGFRFPYTFKPRVHTYSLTQMQAQEQLQHHSTDSLALGLRGAPAGAAAVEAAAAIRAAAPTSTCAPVAPEGSPCGVCGRHGSKTGICGSGGSTNSFRNSGKGAAGDRPAVVRMQSWPEWGMGVSGLRQAAVAAARVVAVPSPLCRRNIGFKCVFMSRQQHTCDAYAAEEGYERQ